MSEISNPNQLDIILYTTPNGNIKVEVFYQSDSVWLTQKRMAELFGVTIPTINEHLSNIFKSSELDENRVIRKFLTTADDGKNYQTNFYNLDAIISVGYRVNSTQATQFRIWATQTLREYIIKGFVLDDERLKNGEKFGKDYFQELLERVRSIRASERRIYQKITDIFEECSIDFNIEAQAKKDFYATIQNKFHYAITGQTAAEIVHTNVDSTKENMGLTTWKHSPTGRILKADTKIAKNYLSQKDIKSLERSVSSYFDYIEGIIERNNTFTMAEFAASVEKFLSFNEYKILNGKGSVSHDQAEKKAHQEYDKFNKTQKIDSDFDREVARLKNND